MLYSKFWIYLFNRGLVGLFERKKSIFRGVINQWNGTERHENDHGKRDVQTTLAMFATLMLLQVPLMFLSAYICICHDPFRYWPSAMDGSYTEMITAEATQKGIEYTIVLLFFGHEVFRFFNRCKAKFSDLKTS